jgi:hypothetical protein
VKRLVAVVLGALGLTAWLKRRRQPAVEPSPADDLRAKLAETKAEPEPEPEPEPEVVPVPPEDVATRRADVHDRARQAMAELRDEPE